MQAILRGELDCDIKVGYLCARFVYMLASVKTHMENGLNKLFGFHGQTIYVSDQDFFTFKDSGLRDE